MYKGVTVDYRQIANDNIANQIHGFTIDYSNFILIRVRCLSYLNSMSDIVHTISFNIIVFNQQK